MLFNSLKAFLLLLILLLSLPALAADKVIRIGVLSHRGDDVIRQIWAPTANYLNTALKDYQFEIVPLKFDEIEPAVKNSEIDFLLVNSGIYVSMEVRYRVSRIATLNNSVGNIPLNVFGGVIFVRQLRNDINTLEDLRGKKVMAVDKTSLGGFQMEWGVLKEAKIDPFSDFASLSFGETHDKVVMAVRDSFVDVGMVRSGILEKVAAKGDIRPDEFKIIHPVIYDGFPYIHSTPLYPEWPFSKLQNTSNELAQKVAIALFQMSKQHTGKNSHYFGWTIPLDYQQVHELFKQLKLPPYEDEGKFTLQDAIKRYWKGIAIVSMFLLMLTIMSTWVARLNAQLKKSKRSLEHQHDLVLNSVCDGIYGVDTNGNCTFMNRSMRKMTGWQLQEMQNGNQHDLLHHSHEDGTLYKAEDCPVYMTFRDETLRFIADDVFWKKDGSSFPVEYSCTPMKDHTGKTIGSVVVFRDISERKKAEEENRRHQKELAHMARLNTMGEMASGIAHELNQPLTAIATNSFACIQMLESGQLDAEKLIDVLETIGIQAEHSGGIIRQLRQFVCKEQPERSRININTLIEEVLLFIRPEARKASVRVIRKMAPDIKEVLAQPIQIEQVLLNLCKNSIEAMLHSPEDNRFLTITTEMAGDNAVIVTVEDTGPGIDDKIKQGLFDPFVTSKDNGLGLGLSISQGIIESHQGQMYLHSASAEGTAFRFALPVISDSEQNNNRKNISENNATKKEGVEE